MRPRPRADNFSLAVRLSAKIVRLEAALKALEQSGSASVEGTAMSRALLRRALKSKRATLDHLVRLQVDH